jgi:type I restriction enzyme, S subunit
MKAEPYKNYKPANAVWLSALPKTWDQIRGRFVMAVNPPARRVRALDEIDEVSFVPMEAVGEYGGLDLERTKPLDEIGAGYTAFEEGDVLVAKITPCFENGKGAIARGLKNGVGFGTTELHVLRAGKRLEKQFLFYLTISHTFRMLGESEMYGAGGQKRVPPEFAKDFRIPLPPLDEQQTIARFLDAKTAQIDELIAKKRQLIDKLKEKRSALIARTVTRGLPPAAAKAAGLEQNPEMKDSRVEWLGALPAHWGIEKFSREVYIAEGQVDPEMEPFVSMILIAPNHIESGTGRLLALETAAEQFAESGKYLCPADAVVYSKIRPALRKVVIAPEQCLCSADMYPLTCRKKLLNPYLYWLLLSDQFSAWSVLEADRVAMPKINRETLNELRLPVPPQNEQIKIVEYLATETTKVDHLLAKADAVIRSLIEYRQSLITSAVTGKIDVQELA